MRETIAQLDFATRTLQAAEFLYYDAQRILENNPKDENARLVQSLIEPLIVGDSAELPAQVVLTNLIDRLKQEELSKNKEIEGKSHYVATIGLDSVGKSGITNHLKEKYGFEAHPLSDRLIDIGFALGYEPPFDRDKLHEISNFIKSKLGKGVLIRFAESLFARLDQPNRVLFDGIRLPEEVVELLYKELSSDVTVIVFAIETGEQGEADLKERFTRSLDRNGEKDTANFEEFRRRSLREAPGIEEAMNLAHKRIYNRRGKQEEMLAEIDAYMESQGISQLVKAE